MDACFTVYESTIKGKLGEEKKIFLLQFFVGRDRKVVYLAWTITGRNDVRMEGAFNDIFDMKKYNVSQLQTTMKMYGNKMILNAIQNLIDKPAQHRHVTN